MNKKNHYYHNSVIFTLLFMLFFSFGFSQSAVSQHRFWSKVSFGGGLGLNFGNNYHNITVAPSAIYHVNNNFSTGVGLNFNASKFGSSSLQSYGISLNNYYSPLPYLQLSGEFEESRVHKNLGYDGANITDTYWYPALFLGLGYRMKNVTVGLRYDVLYDENKSIYGDPYIPFIRVYF